MAYVDLSGDWGSHVWPLLFALVVGGMLVRSGDGSRELAWVRAAGVLIILACLSFAADQYQAGGVFS